MMPNLPFQIKSRFVILAGPRTGSALLVSLLNSIPEIKCYNELFNPPNKYHHQLFVETQNGLYQDSQVTDLCWQDKIKENPVKYLNDVLNIRTQRHSVGFKFMLGYQDQKVFDATKSNQFHKIILRRHSISRYISLCRAHATKSWFVHKLEQPINLKLTFYPKQLKDFLWCCDRFERHVSELQQCPTNLKTFVNYDEVVQLEGVRRIVTDLGLVCPPNETIFSSHKKQTIEPIETLFVNYKEMKKYLLENHKDLMEQPDAPKFT